MRSEQQNHLGISRRSFLTASAGIVLCKLTWAEERFKDVLADPGDMAREQSTGTELPITSRTGHAQWVGSTRDRTLRLDGYSVWITSAGRQLPLRASSVTIAAWIASEAYPVDEAAILHMKSQSGQEFRLALDSVGFVVARRKDKENSSESKIPTALGRGEWRHVAAVFSDTAATLYVDGQAAAEEKVNFKDSLPISGVDVTIGRSPDCSVIAGVFPSGVVNGLLRDVRVFNSALSADGVKQLALSSKPGHEPDLQMNADWCGGDPHRPAYHALPPRAWTNEPHGVIHWGGQYHLFYQKNANGPYWGNINWGHMTSPDLYRWTEQPVALSPEPGPDCKGCWSGSVVEFNGKLAILYTGGNGTRASICLATSDDGIHFNKYAGNPVIAAVPDYPGIVEFRDPHVWREGDIYYVLIGSGIKNVGGTALLYKSADLVHWTYCKPLLVGDRENSGVFWEMPVFFRAGSEHVLIVCEVPGRASYWIGSWKDETFVPRETHPRRLDLFNHMLSPTPCVLSDGRPIMMGIIPDQRSPKDCWRAGWAHLYSLPRVVSSDGSGHLQQIPYEGIQKFFEPLSAASQFDLSPGSFEEITGVSGKSLHLELTFHRGVSHAVVLRLRCSADLREFTEIRYSWEFGKLTLDRTHSSMDPSVVRDLQETIHFPSVPEELRLEVFLDHSVLEVFVDQRSAFATRIYPTLDSSTGILLGTEGGTAVAHSIRASQVKLSRS